LLLIVAAVAFTPEGGRSFFVVLLSRERLGARNGLPMRHQSTCLNRRACARWLCSVFSATEYYGRDCATLGISDAIL
jgi:hypothetical protein